MIENKDYSLLDNTTGEILEYRPKRKRIKYIFALYFPNKNKSVLDLLIYRMSDNNISALDKVSRTITDLKIARSVYFKQIDDLIKNDICIRITNRTYFINPSLYLKSSRRAFDKLNKFYMQTKSDQQQKEIEKLKLARAGDKLINKVHKLLDNE